jgi:hypothetical protein
VPRAKLARKHLPIQVGGTGSISWSVGTEAANAIAVTGQIKDENGKNVTTGRTLTVYVSGVADTVGADVVGTAPTGGVAIGASGKVLAAVVANKVLIVATSATGAFVLTLTDTGTAGFRLVGVLPDGSRGVSGPVQFA